MRYMGIDYGKKRVGVALSNENGDMGFPYQVFPNDEELLKTIESLVAERGVGEIVIGHSLSKEGMPNVIQEAINEFIGDITLHIGIPVHLEPEQYSTQEATRFQERGELTDASAAAVILNSYLTRKKHTS